MRLRIPDPDARGVWLCVVIAAFCLGCWLGHRAGYNQAQMEQRGIVK